MATDSPRTEEELALAAHLDAPGKTQEYLDKSPCPTNHRARSPRRVMRERIAHCSESAMFAAAALGFDNYPPLLLDLRAADDDDHVSAIYRFRDLIGAVARPNFSPLRFREPVYRSYHELATSYVEPYDNMLAERSLRSYSRPPDLRRYDARNWMTPEQNLRWIGDRLDALHDHPLIDE